MEKYKVPNFIIHSINNENSVIQNEFGTVIIEDYRLCQFYTYLDEKRKYTLNIEELEKEFGSEVVSVKEFLINNSLLFKVYEKKVIYKRIMLATNDKKMRDILHSLLRENTEIPILLYTTEDFFNNLNDSLDNTLIINFMDSYSSEMVNQLIDVVNNSSNSSLLLSHVYNSSVILHCLYSSDYMTPCPKCTKGVVSGQIYESKGGITYQQLLKLIYDLDENFKVNFPISFKNKLLICNQIEEQLKYALSDDYSKLDTKYNEFSDIYRLDLSDNKITKDSAVYWELCDCYERI